MKKTIIMMAIVAVVSILPTFLGSCRRTSHNGEIDGFWRITEIEYFASDGGSVRVETPKDHFIAINLELMQLCRRNDYVPYDVAYQATGIISYKKGADKLGVEFPTATAPDKLQLLYSFGIPENPVMFEIETLSCKKLVLKTATTRISCRKF